jgi:hypothetical protein
MSDKWWMKEGFGIIINDKRKVEETREDKQWRRN